MTEFLILLITFLIIVFPAICIKISVAKTKIKLSIAQNNVINEYSKTIDQWDESMRSLVKTYPKICLHMSIPSQGRFLGFLESYLLNSKFITPQEMMEIWKRHGLHEFYISK